MLDAIRAKVADAGMTNVECVQAGFLSYEHESAPVDAVYIRNALHHLPDFWKGIALSRMAGVLRPGGILRLRDLVFSFSLAEAEAGIAAWLDAVAVEGPEEGWTRAELETHLREEFSTFAWLLEPMLEQAGFEIVARDFGTVGAYADYVCVKRS
jgi:ubiquinone/menaquinone biosynthesis C-methylase UbiE